jgi:hypothetical protein
MYWPAGHATLPHDHGGHWGIEVVLDGALHVEELRVSSLAITIRRGNSCRQRLDEIVPDLCPHFEKHETVFDIEFTCIAHLTVPQFLDMKS